MENNEILALIENLSPANRVSLVVILSQHNFLRDRLNDVVRSTLKESRLTSIAEIIKLFHQADIELDPDLAATLMDAPEGLVSAVALLLKSIE